LKLRQKLAGIALALTFSQQKLSQCYLSFIISGSGFSGMLHQCLKNINFVKNRVMRKIEMTAVFEPCDDGGFMAYVQEISGINTQGETLEEARDNLADAVNLVFEDIRAKSRKGRSVKMITQTMSFTF